MQKTDIESLPQLVQQGCISTKKAARIIWTEIYTNSYLYGLKNLDEDERSDFLLYLHTRFEKIFSSYNSDVIPFKIYIKGYLKNYLKTWRRNKAKAFAETHSVDSLLNSFIENESSKFISTDTPDNAGNTHQKSTKSHSENSTSETKQRIAELSALVLTLKACRDVDDEMIEKISTFAGIKRELIDEKILKLKEKLSASEKRQELLIKKRDNSFFYHRKYSVELTHLDKGSHYYSKISEKNELQKKKWQKQNEQLLCVKQPSPSNEDIANILGLKPRTVSFYIRRLKKEENLNAIRKLYIEKEKTDE